MEFGGDEEFGWFGLRRFDNTAYVGAAYLESSSSCMKDPTEMDMVLPTQRRQFLSERIVTMPYRRYPNAAELCDGVPNDCPYPEWSSSEVPTLEQDWMKTVMSLCVQE